MIDKKCLIRLHPIHIDSVLIPRHSPNSFPYKLDMGPVGFIWHQLTNASGADAQDTVKYRLFGAGLEVNYKLRKWFGVKARGAIEFGAENSSEGGVFILELNFPLANISEIPGVMSVNLVLSLNQKKRSLLPFGFLSVYFLGNIKKDEKSNPKTLST